MTTSAVDGNPTNENRESETPLTSSVVQNGQPDRSDVERQLSASFSEPEDSSTPKPPEITYMDVSKSKYQKLGY